MKKVNCFLLFIAVFSAFNMAFAQSPNMFKYQAVLRDVSGNIMANSPQTVVINILQGGSSGTSVYQETQAITTTAQGIINLNIGAGVVNSGVFANINWGAGPYWIKITIGATVISNGQLLSVPYSLYAASSQWVNGTGGIISYSGGYVGIGTAAPTALLHLKNSADRTNLTIESSSANYGPEFHLISTATNGHEWRIVSGASASNSYGVGSFELYDATAAASRFGIMANGNVGIGTTAPTTKLHVAGQLRIVDGTQGANKVLTSDANGNSSWVTNTGIIPAVVASLSSTPYNLTNIAGQYTGSSITLGPGKWSIQVTMLMNADASSLWVRSSFSSSSSSFISSPDIIGASYFSGLKEANVFGIVNGTVILNNTSGSAKTYYYWTLNIQVYSGSLNLSNFGTSLWMEDQMVAYPMN